MKSVLSVVEKFEPVRLVELHAGQSVEVHSFGRWYPGEVLRVGRTRAVVRYATGTGTSRDKAIPEAKIRRKRMDLSKPDPLTRPVERSREEFIQYLRETLIPDLRISGRDFTADDFETAIRFMEEDR